jgi:hypothetical protein
VRARSAEYGHVQAAVRAVSLKAVLIRTEECRDVWVPKSLFADCDADKLFIGVIDEFNIESWFIKKEDL